MKRSGFSNYDSTHEQELLKDCRGNWLQVIGSSSLSVGPVANATDVLQPGWLIVLTLSPPACLDVPTFAARYPHIPNDTRDPSSERWNCVGKN